MQPDTFIQIPASLKAAIETAAAADGRSTNDWIIGQLENAVAQAKKFAAERRNFEEKQQKENEAKSAKNFEEIETHQRWTGL
jgi:hypothetical protein